MGSIARRVLIVTISSWALWSASVALRPNRHPWADLSNGWFSDHYSHMNAARALPRVGLDLYRHGPAERFPVARGPLPADLRGAGGDNGGAYVVPGMAATKPWATSWSRFARPYPPGDLLVVAPIALLYEWTSMSFSTANLLLILWFLALGHVAFALAWTLALRAPAAQRSWAIAAAVLFTLETIHWSLQGFYDVAMLLPLLLCVAWLTRGRPLASLLAYSVAVFVHYRALFLAPIALLTIWQMGQARAWRSFRTGDWVAAVVGVALAAVSFCTLWLVRPTLAQMPLNNAAHLWSRGPLEPQVWAVLAWSGGLALLLARARAWLDVALLLWLALVLVSVRQCMPWHALVLLPWFFLTLPPGANARPAWVMPLRSLAITTLSAWLLHNPLWPERWLPLLWR